jgi:hypothetical protein
MFGAANLGFIRLRSRLLILLWACSAGLLNFLPFAFAQELAGLPGTVTLQGGIEHSERLEPLPDTERVGSFAVPFAPQKPVDYSLQTRPNVGATGARSTNLQPFAGGTMRIDSAQAAYRARLRQLVEANNKTTVAQAKSKKPKTLKLEVPLWLAGYWQRLESNEVSRVVLPDGKRLAPLGRQKAVVMDKFGTYKDKSGKVLMLVPLSTTGAVDRGSAVDYHRVKKYDLILSGKTSALVKVQASHNVVDKRTGRVTMAYQDEELNQYRLVKDGLVETVSSVKVFDQMGQPKLLTKAVSQEKRLRKI